MRATLEASLATGSERVAAELLSLVCDAVVTLDDCLRIKQHAPSFAALLCRSSAPQLYNEDFEELVCNGNCEHFEACMADCSRAQYLRPHLRDTNGTSVGVQLEAVFAVSVAKFPTLCASEKKAAASASGSGLALTTARTSPLRPGPRLL